MWSNDVANNSFTPEVRTKSQPIYTLAHSRFLPHSIAIETGEKSRLTRGFSIYLSPVEQRGVLLR